MKKNKIVIWDIQNREGIKFMKAKENNTQKKNQKALIKGALMGII